MPGKEDTLREVLHKTIQPMFPSVPSKKLDAAIEKQLKIGFNLKRYLSDIHSGKGGFCDDCLEPRCCTISKHIILYKDDVERLEKHGCKDFKKLVVRRDGDIIMSIKETEPCMFLKEGRCTIYKFRPYACWRYPMAENEENKNIFLLPLDCQIGFNLIKQQIIDQLKEKP